MPPRTLDYNSVADERPTRSYAPVIVTAIFAAAVIGAYAFLVRYAKSHDYADLAVLIFIGPAVNSVLMAVSLFVAFEWKMNSAETRVGPLVIAGISLPIVGYFVVACFLWR